MRTHLGRWVNDGDDIIGQIVGYSGYVLIMKVDSPKEAGWTSRLIKPSEDIILTEINDDDKFSYLTVFDACDVIYAKQYSLEIGCDII